ncbi:MAG: UDP-N-acetylglucosamine 1-carboxyvinyltransferase [Bacilli bacterium]|nr:UDP-N-acetylglucosamine 1-carboxyvinyltransferase [Mycoplasmatota bacterium]MDY4237285.1 UDP-N-acetylglucosamine 1-carboxyvinyltransferase [Bacilli bacterium]
MKQIKIKGKNKLTGTIRISGAKNAAVALIPAAILSDEEVTICNVPEISDINSLEEILKYLGVKFSRATESIIINAKDMTNKEIPEDISRKLRASYYFMGALLSKYKKVEMYFPGGCNIGSRPINLHLDGFKKLGATIIEENDKYTIEAKKLVGTKIDLELASVGATINIILAATKAKGITTITNAACEPEIKNVCDLLNSMGAKITGAGTSTIKIKGVSKLKKGYVEVIPDRIEAGTYIIIGSLIGENLKIDNIIPEHLEALTTKLIESNANIEIGRDYVLTSASQELKSVDVETYYFPGFPTDLQQPFSVYLTQAKGVSTLKETIYENRFMHIPYLNRMGANIKIDGGKLKIKGKTPLEGKMVTSTDLRGGAAMIVAGLIAKGTTTINDVEHILRGYEGIVEKLSLVGAKIEIREI